MLFNVVMKMFWRQYTKLEMFGKFNCSWIHNINIVFFSYKNVSKIQHSIAEIIQMHSTCQFSSVQPASAQNRIYEMSRKPNTIPGRCQTKSCSVPPKYDLPWLELVVVRCSFIIFNKIRKVILGLRVMNSESNSLFGIFKLFST